MKNRRYAFHPEDFAIGENEKFYSDMAARGWRLKKRGAYLSRSERTEPEKVLYRIEIAKAGIDEGGLTDEQLELFQQCGWEFVTSRGVINVFRAIEGSGAPEFYMEPEQQATTVKILKNQYIWGLVSTILILAIHFSLAVMASSVGTAGYLARLGAGVVGAFIEETALMLGVMFLLLELLFSGAYGAVRTALLYKRLRRGKALDHAPQKRMFIYKGIKRVFIGLTALFVILAVVQWATVEKYLLPMEADGPYVTLEELGWNGERDDPFGKDPTVKISESLMATHYDVNEYLTGEQNVWIYEDIYKLRFPSIAMKMAQSVMEGSGFNDKEDYKSIDIPGTQAAWYGRLETVAVYDEYVIYITYLPADDGPIEMASKAIQAIIKNIEIEM